MRQSHPLSLCVCVCYLCVLTCTPRSSDCSTSILCCQENTLVYKAPYSGCFLHQRQLCNLISPLLLFFSEKKEVFLSTEDIFFFHHFSFNFTLLLRHLCRLISRCCLSPFPPRFKCKNSLVLNYLFTPSVLRGAKLRLQHFAPSDVRWRHITCLCACLPVLT